MLDAVAKGKALASLNMEVADFPTRRIAALRQEPLPIRFVRIPARVLTRGDQVEHDQFWAVHVAGHDLVDVPGPDRGGETVLQHPYLLVVISHCWYLRPPSYHH